MIPPGVLREAIEQLLHLKQLGEELAWGPSIPPLNDWIEAELTRLAHGPALAPVDHPGPEPLNALFRAWLPDDAYPHDA